MAVDALPFRSAQQSSYNCSSSINLNVAGRPATLAQLQRLRAPDPHQLTMKDVAWLLSTGSVP